MNKRARVHAVQKEISIHIRHSSVMTSHPVLYTYYIVIGLGNNFNYNTQNCHCFV